VVDARAVHLADLDAGERDRISGRVPVASLKAAWIEYAREQGEVSDLQGQHDGDDAVASVNTRA